LTTIELLKFFFTSGFPELGRKLHLRFSPKEQADFFHKAFVDTLAYREKNNIKRNDFVSMLLDLKEHFTPSELAAESFLVFSGGVSLSSILNPSLIWWFSILKQFESSSTLITFTLYEIASNSEIQTRLREEISSELDANDGKITYDMLHGFKYLHMVVQESLRKFPPIPNAQRKCVKDYQIPGTSLTIPKGTTIQLNTYSVHHDPEYYPEPDKFDPERFTDENIKARHPLAFSPFGKISIYGLYFFFFDNFFFLYEGDGPRNCIGLR
jgi:cytochrome P450 family 6